MLTRRQLLLLAPLVAAAACAQPTGTTLERARSSGVLRVGIAGERPFGYVGSGGELTGSQPVVARAVLGRIGVGGLEAVQVRFADLIPGLQAGRFDLIAAGLTITPERCGEIAFSRPDFVSPPAFLVLDGNPRGIGTFQGVRRSGVRLAVLDRSSELEYARGAGISEDRLVLSDSQGDLFRDVVDGRAEVGALTAVSLVDELRRNPGLGVEITDPVDPTIDGRTVVPASAFAARIGETDLLAAFDAELTALQASGEWLSLTEPFGLGAGNLPDPDLTVEALCAPP
ncbi:transporter substrate-binding domain-containing protein [Pseudonocardia abyssalis]|uniref:Transporter substrate-binding domain-containing protein n=1 Tax=Pseudonocardia abyssalis TaxID=2792008 RepID=A0ABS6UUL3_9PSEU|nr:transporter substrate-binding domain-containing protein [Pseudonocardia abyssalis]MBW0114386.1 transporter substrate-binding domain-containing protein [Pseudonocardia abyssalis]MBW0135857.1 transporter substrate-binding domain-containing protein [Pseudonocardia abyssalis]